MVWNDNLRPGVSHLGPRTPLTCAVSGDWGKTWKFKKNLEDEPEGSFAYTSVLFSGEDAFITYYVHRSRTGRLSLKFKRIPVVWFYR